MKVCYDEFKRKLLSLNSIPDECAYVIISIHRICGNSYNKSTESVYNTMMVTYETFDLDLGSSFNASVTLLNRESNGT